VALERHHRRPGLGIPQPNGLVLGAADDARTRGLPVCVSQIRTVLSPSEPVTMRAPSGVVVTLQISPL
jgi:hypothetical protein